MISLDGRVTRRPQDKAPLTIRLTGETEVRMWRIAKHLHLKMTTHKTTLIESLVYAEYARLGLDND
jgi:hypothetical protein